MTHDISSDQLNSVADGLGISLSSAETEDLGALANVLVGVMAAVHDLPSGVEAPVPAARGQITPPTAADDPLNAIVQWCHVKAEDASGPLSTMRVAVKDCIAIAGIPMTAGSSILRDFVPSIDSTVVRRVLAAGGEIVAVTNMDSLAMAAGGDSSVYGPTLCPLDVQRTAGGSSSGSAAALHYDSVDVSLGTDTGGSVRVPSSWCGVLGLKPTHGVVPYTGVLAIDQRFDHVGPLSRTVADMAQLMQVIAGNDGIDPRQRQQVPAVDYVAAAAQASTSLAGCRIGLVSEAFSAEIGVDPQVDKAVRAAVEKLVKLGAEVTEVSIPEHLAASPVMFSMLAEGLAALLAAGGNGYQWEGEYWPELSAAIHAGMPRYAAELSPQVKLSLIVGTHMQQQFSGGSYARASNARRWLRAGYDRALSECDILLMPTTPGLPHVNDPDLNRPDRVMRSWGVLANTSPTNITGHPAITMPMATVGQLPVGVMAVARSFEDARLLALASTIEQSIGWNVAERG